MKDEFKSALEGKKVVRLAVSEGENNLYFFCDDGTIVVWSTYGDCCSESWWADITGVNELLQHGRWGTQVRWVEMISMPRPMDERTRQESDLAYGYWIHTTGGVCACVFRNSSNGYYGGEMTENVVAEVDGRMLTTIESDWSA